MCRATRASWVCCVRVETEVVEVVDARPFGRDWFFFCHSTIDVLDCPFGWSLYFGSLRVGLVFPFRALLLVGVIQSLFHLEEISQV